MSTNALLLLTFQIAASYIVHLIGKHYYQSRLDRGKTYPKVFDIGHKFIPDYSDNPTLVNLSNILTLLPFFVFVYHKDLKSIQTVISFGLTIHIIRLLFLIVTILPKHKTCDDTNYTWYNIVNGHCYDKVFSGHFAVLLLFVIVLHANYNISLIYIIPYVIVVGMIILSIRSHYTIDLLVATLVTNYVYCHNIQLF
jgi:hypothetical protein